MHGTTKNLLSHVEKLQKESGSKDNRKKLDELVNKLINDIKQDSGKRIDAAFAQLLIDDLTYIQGKGQ